MRIRLLARPNDSRFDIHMSLTHCLMQKSWIMKHYLYGIYSVADMDRGFIPLLSVILSLMPIYVSLLLVGLFPPLTEKAGAAFC